MQGLPITATSLEWPPYISIENCSNIGRNCSKSGYLVEFMDIWARELNFTWDIYADVNNSWGLDPIEGTTHSCSRAVLDLQLCYYLLDSSEPWLPNPIQPMYYSGNHGVSSEYLSFIFRPAIISCVQFEIMMTYSISAETKKTFRQLFL